MTTKNEVLEYLKKYNENLNKKRVNRHISKRIYKQKKHKIKLITWIGLILFGILIVFIFFRPNLTGFVVGEVQGEYSEFTDITYNQSGEYILTPEESGELISLAISGKISTTGRIIITIEDKTIFDSNQLSEEEIKESGSGIIFGALTGRIIDNENIEIKEESPTEDKTKKDKEFEEKPIKKEKSEEPTAETSEETSTQVEETTIEPTEDTQPDETIEEIPEDVQPEETTENATEEMPETIQPEETEETNLTQDAPIADINETIKNETEILEPESNIEKESPEEITIEEKIEFEDYCLETCYLTNLNQKNYTIKIEIENATFTLKKIKYRISNPEPIAEMQIMTSEEFITTEQDLIQIGEPVIWTQSIKLIEPQTIITTIPFNSRNIEISKIINNTKYPINEVDKKINRVEKVQTGKPILNIVGNNIETFKQENKIEITIEGNNLEYEIEYETEPPKKEETTISSNRKIITIYTDDELNYTNINASTTINPETKKENIQLLHLINGEKVIVDFTPYDLNNNSLIDYIEWIVPHLSNQTYELSIASIGEEMQQSKSPTSTGKFSNEWITPENAYFSNNLYAEENRNGESQDWYDFNFTIPENSEISGIEILVEGNDPAWANQGVIVSISKDNGNTFLPGIELNWPNVDDQIRTIGNSTFLWGTSWEYTDLSNEQFIIKLEKTGNDWNSFRVDNIQMNVFYTETEPQTTEINLMSPENNLETTNIPKFKFNFTSQTEEELSCLLILNDGDDQIYWSNLIQNSTETTINLGYLDFNEYQWYINCSNENETFTSKKRIFNYSQTKLSEEIKTPTATGYSNNQWSNPQNAYFTNNLYAEENRNGETQDWYNFNFSIPPNSEITGIEVSIEGNDPTWGNQGVLVALSQNMGTTYSTEKAITWGTINDEIKTIGNSTDLWGFNWNNESISNQNFLIRLTKTGNDYNSINVDNIQAKIHFKEISTQKNYSATINIYTDLMTDLSIGLNEGPLETNTSIKFQVTHSDNSSLLNDSTAKIKLIKNDTAREGICEKLNNETSELEANYTCLVKMQFWDEPGNWGINASINDISNKYYENSSEEFTIGATSGFIISETNLIWPELSPSTQNVESLNSIKLQNTGNIEQIIKIYSTDLIGKTSPEFIIPANNFLVGITSGCNGTQMQKETEITIENSTLKTGNYLLNIGNGEETLFFCINEIPEDIPSQGYSTENNSWIIKIFTAIISIRKRRIKKEIEKLNKTGITNAEILETINETNIQIPITIFQKNIGALEAITKFLKENIKINYSDIARELNRDQRTIWTAHKKSKEKIPKKFKRTKSETVPITIFQNNNLTILESIIKHLKKSGLKYSEIGILLNRNERNIWTINNRINQK